MNNSIKVYGSFIVKPNCKLACFDLDWTLIRSAKSRFFKSSDDWSLLPDRKNALLFYQQNNYNIVIFSNQNYKGKKLSMALERVENVYNFLKSLGIGVTIFVSTKKDEYRKPDVGMFNFLLSESNNTFDKNESFYVGDAAGRLHDFSDSDLMFAKNCDLRFYIPEEFFSSWNYTGLCGIKSENELPNLNNNKKCVILTVGMQGSGKTWFCQNVLTKYVHISKDELKTDRKVLLAQDKCLENDQNCVIDATNPTIIGRQQFINLAHDYGFNVVILYFISNGYGRNKHRQHPVPDIAYNVYFKKLEEPENTKDVPLYFIL